MKKRLLSFALILCGPLFVEPRGLVLFCTTGSSHYTFEGKWKTLLSADEKN